MFRETLTLSTLVLAAALVLPSPGQAQAAKIGIIDVQKILTDSAPGKEAVAKIKALQDAKLGEAKSKQDEIAALRQKINDGRLSLAEDKLADLEKQVDDKTTDFRRFQDDAQKELQRRQEEAFDVIEKRVNPIIAELGKAGAFGIILRKFDSGLVYADDSLDITEQVIQKLNAAAAPKGK
ncbi:MAG: OmpH family outer membrane protein [Acidobacteriota bacterium]